VTASILPPIDRRAVLVFGALVLLLLAPWPRWGRVFGTLFSGYGNALIAMTSDVAPAPRFALPPRGTASPADGGDWAVVLTVGDQTMPLDTRIIGYTPLALFLALALATPLPRRRKALVLAGGGALLLARLAFAVLVPLGGALGGGGNAGSLSEVAWTVLVAAPAMSYAAPLAVWWVALALTTPRAEPKAAPTRRRSRAAVRRA
jgi:hypothetical protein